MLKRLQRKLAPPPPDAPPPLWQQVLQHQQREAAPAPDGLITPPPPQNAPAPSRPAGRTAYASQGDLLAWNSDLIGAQRAYRAEADKAPLDPLPVIQMIRLREMRADADSETDPEMTQLRTELAARVPQAGRRVLAWFSLYHPRLQQDGRWTCRSLARLIAQSQVARLDAATIKEVLGEPCAQGMTWLTRAASHGQAADVEALLALCGDPDAWAQQTLVDTLLMALKHREVGICAGLIKDSRFDMAAVGAANVKALLEMGAHASDDRLQKALSERHLHGPGELADALAHHRYARVCDRLKYARWDDPALGAVMQLALDREHERLSLVRAFVKAGMPVNAPCCVTGKTPLMAAIAVGAADVVRLLIQAGADRGYTDTETQLTAASTADALGHKACARELRYPDVFVQTQGAIAAKLVNPDSQSLEQIEALLKKIEPTEFEASQQLLLSMFDDMPINTVQAKRRLRRLVMFPEPILSSFGQVACRWIGRFAQPASRAAMFDLFYLTPSTWWACISAALTEFAYVLPEDTGDPDAWLRRNGKTIATIFETWAGASRPKRERSPWAWTYMLHMSEKHSRMQDADRARLLALATACETRGYRPSPEALPSVAIAAMSKRSKPLFARFFSPQATQSAAAADVDVTAEVAMPRDASVPFAFHVPQKRQSHLHSDLLVFLQSTRLSLMESASEDVCNTAERLLTQGDTLDELDDMRVALAYLQLIQAVVGAKVTAEVFGAPSADVNTTPVKRLQLKAHPDKGGLPGLASCLNALVVILDNKTGNYVIAARALRAAYDSTADRRAAFYG